MFRKTWIDTQYRKAKKAAVKENAKVRPYASKEDKYYFYLKLKRLYAPINPLVCPTRVVVH